MEKLDGVIVGGCYLRAELDDQGWYYKNADVQ